MVNKHFTVLIKYWFTNGHVYLQETRSRSRFRFFFFKFYLWSIIMLFQNKF